MWESHSYGSERDGAATANPGAPRLLDPALSLGNRSAKERGQAHLPNHEQATAAR
jgi:hypothetical protein